MAKGSNNLSGRRSSSHNTKPYDANNSFVKKVATKVTDLLPQRLWISKWFNTSQNDEDILEDNENPEEVELEEDIQKPPPLKRPCIRMDVTHPPGTFSIQPRAKSTVNKASSSKQQYFINETSEDFSKPAMAGPSGMSHLVTSTPAIQSDIRNIAPQRSELNALVATTNNGTTNGMDDNSESSESTSGCSSLIPQINRQEAPSNVYISPFSNRKRFDNDKLNFTNHMQSPRSLFLENTRDSLSSRRPSFNASIMTNTPDRASPLASPFYSGNTTFGGANAAGLYKRGRNLFNNSNEIQLKVPKRTSVEVKPSNTDSSGMSQTAKKILEALEHFSSPITDAKKIPLKVMNNTSPISKKRSREEMTSTTKVGLRHLTRELTVPTIPDILKLRRRQKLQDTTAAARKIVSARSEPPPPQEYHLRTQTDDDSKHHGKVKTSLDQEDTVEPVNLPNIPLPISSLPNFNFMPSTNTKMIDKTNTDKEDSFTFASPIRVTNTTKNLKSINNFTFSSPINADKQLLDKSNNSGSPLKRIGVKSNTSDDYIPPVTQNFIWSGSSTAPRLKEKVKNNDSIVPATSNELKSGSVMDILCSKSNTTKSEKSGESKTQLNLGKESINNKTNTASLDTNNDDNIKNVSNSQSNTQDISIMWECSECLFKNNNTETQCFACKATKPSLKDKKTSESLISSNVSEPKTTVNDHFGSQFKLSSNQWECTSCFVRNKQTDTKCIACNALKPDAKQETKSEKCSNCKLHESEKSATCSFCDTSKSSTSKINPQGNANPTVNTDISVGQNTTNVSMKKNESPDKLNSNKDTWECPCCMVRNLMSIDSCPCCNTAKPNAGIITKNTSLSSNGFGDKFKKPEGAWICNTCMLQNDPQITTCVACGNAKPDAGSKKPDNSTSINTNSSLQFNFDMPANTSGFKFGIDKADQGKTDSTISTNGFKFGEAHKNNEIGQFTFGIYKEEAKTNETQKSGNNNISLTSGSSFGVPVNTNVGEKTDTKQDSENTGKNSAPLFSFGMAKSESGAVESNKQFVNVTTCTVTPSTFTFNAPKSSTVAQSNIKEEKQIPLLENTVTETSKSSSNEFTAVNTSTISSIIQSNVQESKSTATFSFGVPNSTIAMTSSTSTTVVSSLPSSTQSSFTFPESKPNTQTSIVPTFGQISTSAPTSNLSNTFTFGDSKTREESSITKTFNTLPNPSGSSLFKCSSISSGVLFGNNDTKAAPTFGQTSTEDNKSTFGAASTSKSSTFAVTENKVPIFGNTENKPAVFGSTDPKIGVFGSTDNKPASLFNPPTALQTPAATPTPFGFGAPSTAPLFGSSVTPVFGNNTVSSTTESTPSIFGSTSKSNETGTSANSNIFTFGTTPAQPIPKPTDFNFSANTNPAESTQKPLFTFGSHSSIPQSNNLFGNGFNNPSASTNSSGFTFNAPKPETSAFAQSTNPSPIFGTSQSGTQNQVPSSFSSTPSNAGFNFGSTAPAATSSGGFNFGAAPASAPSTGFNFSVPNTTPTFDPNTPPTFNFTGGNAPTVFNATPTQTQRKIKKAIRRMR